MFLTSSNVCFVFGYAYFMRYCLKTAIWLFLGQDLAFFGEDRLATLPRSVFFSPSGCLGLILKNPGVLNLFFFR